jgi:hypothetical protein
MDGWMESVSQLEVLDVSPFFGVIADAKANAAFAEFYLKTWCLASKVKASVEYHKDSWSLNN